MNIPEDNFNSAINKNGLIYAYGNKVLEKDTSYNKKRKVLIPFENFVPVLDEIILDMERKEI